MATTTQTKPKCTKGFSCGYACISQSDTCRDQFGEETADFINKMVEAISSDKRSAGAVVTLEELAALKENAEFLANASAADVKQRAEDRGIKELAEQGIEITDKVVDAVWEALPSSVSGKIKLKGGVTKENAYDPETDSFGKNPTAARGKQILKQYLLQNGRDAYTGLPLDGLRSADLEHIEPMEVLGRDADRPSNLALTSAAVNQWKSATPLGEWASNAVRKRSEADVGAAREKQKEKKSKKNALADVLADADISKMDDAFVDNMGSGYHSLGKLTGVSASFRFNRPATGKAGSKKLSFEEGAKLQKSALSAIRDKDEARLDVVKSVRDKVAKVARARAEEKVSPEEAEAQINDFLKELD